MAIADDFKSIKAEWDRQRGGEAAVQQLIDSIGPAIDEALSQSVAGFEAERAWAKAIARNYQLSVGKTALPSTVDEFTEAEAVRVAEHVPLPQHLIDMAHELESQMLQRGITSMAGVSLSGSASQKSPADITIGDLSGGYAVREVEHRYAPAAHGRDIHHVMVRYVRLGKPINRS